MAKKSKIATVTRVTAVPAATCASSVFPVSVCARWLTAVSCLASVSLRGKEDSHYEA